MTDLELNLGESGYPRLRGDRTLAGVVGDWYRFLLSHRRFLVLGLLVIAIIAVAIALIWPQKWTAQTVILPSRSPSSQMSALGQLGALPGISQLVGGESLNQLYPDIARSQTILRQMLDARLGSGTIRTALLDGDSATPLREELLVDRLRGAIAANTSLRSGICNISVTLHDPELAATVANQILVEMDDFLRNRLELESRLHRRTIETRLAEVDSALTAAETDLLEFDSKNRTIGSPALGPQRSRLEREVDKYAQLFLELTRQFELAKIQETRESPLLKILDRALVPQIRSSPRRGLVAVGIWIVGAIILVLCLKLRSFWREMHDVKAARPS